MCKEKYYFILFSGSSRITFNRNNDRVIFANCSRLGTTSFRFIKIFILQHFDEDLKKIHNGDFPQITIWIGNCYFPRLEADLRYITIMIFLKLLHVRV